MVIQIREPSTKGNPAVGGCGQGGASVLHHPCHRPRLGSLPWVCAPALLVMPVAAATAAEGEGVSGWVLVFPELRRQHERRLVVDCVVLQCQVSRECACL